MPRAREDVQGQGCCTRMEQKTKEQNGLLLYSVGSLKVNIVHNNALYYIVHFVLNMHKNDQNMRHYFG